ncbi:ankyrin repeat domain-containing protein [Amaricoccus sp.]|uniref:ankyrin repeat domain-containing protein n=1 Tax=Amaricoccus sp. TaxID=1872485 RepID=UPI002BAE5015|nr:ankyrin repeat domain-containing protein [Amaricoccus sp.]HMQ94387.1 ankyrin repeat domain-containing protein [Amaricoccus sp.]HMR61510.1 ankyrin repeat domain-containing protein [Amaricoccus sp.]
MRLRLLTIGLALPALAGVAAAQVAPTPDEVAGYSGLHAAAHAGDAERIAEFAASGADVDARDGAGRTPAHVAAFASNDEALRALAAAGADLNALEGQAYDVLTIAAVANDPALVKLALALGNRADLVTSPYDGTALIAAAHLGHHEVVRVLAAGGAPLDHVNNLGWTALMEAVVLGDGGPAHVATVQVLLSAGADPAIGDRNGVTPLAHAEARGYSQIAALLEAAQLE